MADEFDPDAYLASKKGGGDEFDPDAYLKSKGTQPAQPIAPQPAAPQPAEAQPEEPPKKKGLLQKGLQSAANLYTHFREGVSDVGEGIAAVAEPVAKMATGMVAKPVSDIAGLATIPLHAAGLTKKTPEEVQQGIQEGMTYEPKTEMAKSEYNPLNAVPTLAAKLIDKIRPDKPEDAATMEGMATNLLREAIPQALSLGVAKGAGYVKGKATGAEKAEAPEQETKTKNVTEAHADGYVLPPHLVKKTWTGGIGGKIKTEQEASMRNNENTNRLAREDLGLPKDAHLDEAAFKSVREKANQAYKVIADSKTPIRVDDAFKEKIKKIAGTGKYRSEIKGSKPELEHLDKVLTEGTEESSSSFSGGLGVTKVKKEKEFMPAQVLEQVKQLRQESKKNLKSADGDKHQVGLAQKQMADEMDNLLDRNLQHMHLNKTEVANYRAARKQIAKSYAYESNTNTTTGNVNAHGLAKMHEKGAPLSENAEKIARFARAFRRAAIPADHIGGVPPTSKLDWAATVAAAATGHPAAAVGINLGPIARNIALSDRFQKSLTPKEKSMTKKLVEALPGITEGISAQTPFQMREQIDKQEEEPTE